MVVKSKKMPLVLLVAVFLTLCFIFLNTKYFLAATVAVMGFFLVLYDLRIGIFGALLVYPFLPDMVGLLMFLSLGFFLLLKKILTDDVDFSVTAYGAVIALYFLFATIETVTSINRGGSLRDFGLHMAGISLVFAMTNRIKSKEELNAMVSILLLSVLLVALIGIVQNFTGVQMRPEWLDRDHNVDIATRVYSVFHNPNILAEYLVLMTPLAVGMTWYTKSMKKKFLFGLSTALLLLCLVLTLSRGGWVGISFAALTFILIVNWRLLLLAIPVVTVGLFFLPQKIMARLLTIFSVADSSNAYRLKMWEITLQVIRDHLWGGVGFGYVPFKQTFETYIRTMPIFHAHNTFLQVFAEMGLLGLLVFLFLLWTFIKHPLATLSKERDPYYYYIGAGAVSGLVGLLGHGLFEHVLYLPRIIFSFWIVIGILITLLRLQKKEMAEGEL